MKRLPYTPLEKIMTIASSLILITLFLFTILHRISTEESLLIVIVATLLFLLTLLFEIYPRTTNIVTSKKYNLSPPETKTKLEHRVRLIIALFRLALMLLFLFVLL